jgi:hypothetical protein
MNVFSFMMHPYFSITVFGIQTMRQLVLHVFPLIYVNLKSSGFDRLNLTKIKTQSIKSNLVMNTLY